MKFAGQYSASDLAATYFLIKTISAVFLAVMAVYVIRTFVKSRKKILNPAQGMGADGGAPARNDVSFVVDTFHSMVVTLKEKEKELQELKDKAEERAKSVESYNESILRSVQSGVMSFDRDGSVITANDASGKILKNTHGTFSGQNFKEIFGDGSWVCGLIEKTLAGGRPERRGEGEVRTTDGSHIWLGAGTSPLTKEGELLGVILVFTDITEVKELRERMELKERINLLGEMSAGIAHELRNPMGVISGYADFLARRLSGDAQSQDAVRSISAEIRVMDEIIREFMNFSQPTELNITEIDIGALMDESLRALSGIGGNVKKEIHMEDGLPTVEGDPVLLRQALINIIKNAYEAMPGGGSLRISARALMPGDGADPAVRGQKCIRIDISDSGSGIEKKDLPKIFTPFFTTKPKGTGLGLALVQKIIVYHGGRVFVKADKGGASFNIYLPLRKTGRAA
ncbi:MAG: ATP-binding protein [Nitrospirota bacterium]